MNADEFLKGQKGCKEGVPHETKSESYNRGYAAQYDLEQIQGEKTHEHRRPTRAA